MWHVRVHPWCTVPGQIWVVSYIRLPHEVKKTPQFRSMVTKFSTLVFPPPTSPIRAQFDMQEWMQFWNFRGLLYPPSSLIRAKCGMREYIQISSELIYSVAIEGWKAPNFSAFPLEHSLIAPPSGAYTKLNVGAKLQAFPYPTILKAFPWSNTLMAKSLAPTLPFKSMTDKK